MAGGSVTITVPSRPESGPGTPVAARAREVWKVYGSGEAQVIALRGVSVAVERGTFTAIMGPSGSGTSTPMHRLAGLDSVTRGEVHIGQTKVTGLRDADPDPVAHTMKRHDPAKG